MISIVDYGSGNLQAIMNIYKRLNIPSQIICNPEQVLSAEKLILPGVGAFDESMDLLEKSELHSALDEAVLKHNIPILGVCVGMQIMAMSSEEGTMKGLGWFDAKVLKFDANKLQYKPKIPHMGWNSIKPVRESRLFNDVDYGKGFYFLHSYFMNCHDEYDVLATTNYGSEFVCAVNKNNIYGFQFHPEKSHSNGVNLFKNFAEIS